MQFSNILLLNRSLSTASRFENRQRSFVQRPCFVISILVGQYRRNIAQAIAKIFAIDMTAAKQQYDNNQKQRNFFFVYLFSPDSRFATDNARRPNKRARSHNDILDSAIAQLFAKNGTKSTKRKTMPDSQTRRRSISESCLDALLLLLLLLLLSN